MPTQKQANLAGILVCNAENDGPLWQLPQGTVPIGLWCLGYSSISSSTRSTSSPKVFIVMTS